MVLREKKINNNCDDVQLKISFGLADVKALFKIYASSCIRIKDYQHSEKDVRYWLEHHEMAFLSWPQKWREQLSSWGFAVAVRNKLLIPTSTNENKFYLADCLFAKRGRPQKKDVF